LLSTIAALGLLLSGCGTSVYQPSRVAGFEANPAVEIDDEDIGKAFAAKPQLPDKPNVAYYVFDNEYAEGVDKMLGGVHDVGSKYRIPPLLVSGERRFGESSPYYARESQAVSIKQLRLLAARAHADVLVIIDYGYKVEHEPNGLAALGVAIVPLLFVPYMDMTVESYVDSYVIDTRNGYLYGHLETHEEASDDFHTIYSSADKDMIDAQFALLVERTGKLLSGLLAEERVVSKEPLVADPADHSDSRTIE
jgi:hypothetical protein